MMFFFWFCAWLAASLPWRSSAAFGVAGQWPRYAKLGMKKPLIVTLLESLCSYFCVFAVMFLIESQRGQLSTQRWQFWVIALCLWVVLAFPAAAWFKLRKA